MFQCDCCGLCCMNLKRSSLYGDLDRGDGICRYFDGNARLCTVYENRPDKCFVSEQDQSACFRIKERRIV
ncbi:MAG: YkgJ family cysteine cluster protein [Lachnospiraceae bacterium]|nr:YkgJ family cysteine cluster protein [Lachnospiraceae bacterium]